MNCFKFCSFVYYNYHDCFIFVDDLFFTRRFCRQFAKFSDKYSRIIHKPLGAADDLQGILCAQFSRMFLKISSEIQCSCPVVINIQQKAIISLSTLYCTYIELWPKQHHLDVCTVHFVGYHFFWLDKNSNNATYFYIELKHTSFQEP
jgi:hypothetical protein